MSNEMTSRRCRGISARNLLPHGRVSGRNGRKVATEQRRCRGALQPGSLFALLHDISLPY